MSTPAWVDLKFSTVLAADLRASRDWNCAAWDFPESFAGYRLYHFYQ
jgi:hypothetical protein